MELERRANELGERRDYRGYAQAGNPTADPELTHVLPGTPCGELLRRYWHPVALSSEIEGGPHELRILGEDLVLYRDLGGEVGLLHRNCVHRGASLLYGVCEQRGLRCCYHGWLFDSDGTILETPGEPDDSKGAANLRRNLKQGAYPTREHNGLIFAYLGPPDEQPAFPIFDTFDIAGTDTQPYARDYPCNWLQITENAMDPVHAVFLHVRATGPQFDEVWGQIGIRDFYERPTGLYYTNARRVGGNLWVRIHEIIFPNLTHAGAVMTMDGKTQKYFGRNTFTRWVVPLDNENSRVIAWANFGERTDPDRDDWRTEAGIDVIEGGMPRQRPDAEARQHPGDYEAFVGQGPISVHAKEHLMSSDRGVSMFRTRLKSLVRDLEAGEQPLQPVELSQGWSIPTYCGDTVLRITDCEDDAAVLRHSRQIMEIIRSGDAMAPEERDRHVIDRLRDYEAGQQ